MNAMTAVDDMVPQLRVHVCQCKRGAPRGAVGAAAPTYSTASAALPGFSASWHNFLAMNLFLSRLVLFSGTPW